MDWEASGMSKNVNGPKGTENWEISGGAKGTRTQAPRKNGCGKLALIAMVAMLAVIALLVVAVRSCSSSPSEENNDLDWPTTGLAAMLPDPPSERGKVDVDDVSLAATFEQTGTADYESYIKACKAKGFTVNAEEGKSEYMASNAEGYKLSVTASSDSVSVALEKPEENSAEETEGQAGTASNGDADASESVQPESNNQASTISSSDARKVIDDYEAFMNEYVDFMQKYENSNDTAAMLGDYASIMKRYSDMTDKFEALQDEISQGKLSDEDAAYYLEAQSRVLKKLESVQ